MEEQPKPPATIGSNQDNKKSKSHKQYKRNFNRTKKKQESTESKVTENDTSQQKMEEVKETSDIRTEISGRGSKKNFTKSNKRNGAVNGVNAITRTSTGVVTAVAGEKQETVNETIIEKNNEFTCPICLDEKASFYIAVGSCNHHICSMCALRLRVKSKDRCCALCKQELPIMVVYKYGNADTSQQGLRPYELFMNIFRFSPEDLRCIENNDFDASIFVMPNVDFSIEQRLVYYQCRQHFQKNVQVTSIYCPIRGCATNDGNNKLTFNSYQQLINHINSQHAQKDNPNESLTMCLLCLEHRPLFINEHEVFPMYKFRKHLKGKIAGGGNNSNAYFLGHPDCQFCRRNFFDLQHLYQHMQQQHFTCALCDRSRMFRYYKDQNSLRSHHRSEHFLCTICDKDERMRNSDVAIAFRTVQEYSDHMLGYHQIRSLPSYQRTYSDSDSQYMELEMGSANPYNNQLNSNSRNQHRSGNNNSNIITDIHPIYNIAPNMRLAGRVTGTGRFAPLSDAELALQNMIDESNYPALGNNSTTASSGKGTSMSQRIQQSQNVHLTTSSEQHFPTLSANNESVSNKNNSNESSLHPLSLVGKRSVKVDASSTSTQKDQPMSTSHELTRAQRLAEIFGVKPSVDRMIQESNTLCGNDTNQIKQLLEMYKENLLEKLSTLQCIIHQRDSLLNHFYPYELLSWSRKHKPELLKLERKIITFLTSPRETSLALKAMPYHERCIAHCYGRYFSFNSYEYDKEPKRYVSLVKTTLTTNLQPTAKNHEIELLSTASGWNSMQLITTINDSVEDVRWFEFTVRDGWFFNTWSKSTDQLQLAKEQFALSQVTFGDVVYEILSASLFRRLISHYQDTENTPQMTVHAVYLTANNFALGFTNYPRKQLQAITELFTQLQTIVQNQIVATTATSTSTNTSTTVNVDNLEIGLEEYLIDHPKLHQIMKNFKITPRFDVSIVLTTEVEESTQRDTDTQLVVEDAFSDDHNDDNDEKFVIVSAAVKSPAKVFFPNRQFVEDNWENWDDVLQEVEQKDIQTQERVQADTSAKDKEVTTQVEESGRWQRRTINNDNNSLSTIQKGVYIPPAKRIPTATTSDSKSTVNHTQEERSRSVPVVASSSTSTSIQDDALKAMKQSNALIESGQIPEEFLLEHYQAIARDSDERELERVQQLLVDSSLGNFHASSRSNKSKSRTAGKFDSRGAIVNEPPPKVNRFNVLMDDSDND